MRKPNCVPDVHNIFTCPGNRKKSIFTPRFNGSRVTLVETGTIDIQDEINSYAPYSDLRYMLSRLKVGDVSCVKSQPAFFGDFTAIPRNAIDAVNLVHDVERYFSTLPEEERIACNNDWRVYFASKFSGDSVSSSGVSADPLKDSTIETEVSVNESKC